MGRTQIELHRACCEPDTVLSILIYMGSPQLLQLPCRGSTIIISILKRNRLSRKEFGKMSEVTMLVGGKAGIQIQASRLLSGDA